MQARTFHSGMGQAVAERTILRKIPIDTKAKHLIIAKTDPVHDHMKTWAAHKNIPFETIEQYPKPEMDILWRWEDWADVADRVAIGNCSLVPDCQDFDTFKGHLLSATILMSGRHLQHGDSTQSTRNLEVFTNCSTAPLSFLLFYLLLNGSGVGRSYDDDLMMVNWDNAPTVRCVIREDHPDFDFSLHESTRDAKHKYRGETVHWFEVPDSREGWAQAIEIIESMTFQKAYRDHLLVLDFSPVRERGAPIAGMQNRPSSGPVPLMNAIHKLNTLKGAHLPLWMQSMFVDHYLAEPVLVGGARRAARIAVKNWKDRSIFDFIRLKRPIEYDGMSARQVIAYRKKLRDEGIDLPFSHLWSSNNSVGVDKEFWERMHMTPDNPRYNSDLTRHARAVYEAVVECSYADGTGEPALINLDMLVEKDKGEEKQLDGNFVGSKRYKVMDETRILLSGVAKRYANKPYKMIVNPCGEITLVIIGGYCVIADVVPFHAESFEEAEEAFRYATRALIRTNTMDSLYAKEVKRTNRIGVGITGIHEFAWKFFQVGFRDLIAPDWESYKQIADSLDPSLTYYEIARYVCDVYTGDEVGQSIKAAAFWEVMGQFARSTIREAMAYSVELGVECPHTILTIKPAGTTSKLFGLTEGWHLPALAFYLRWVQFRHDDPLVDKYEEAGYPVRRNLRTYEGVNIVGFPTAPVIGELGIGDKLVLAGEATPEEQYQWLKLGEFFWLEGGNTDEYATGSEPRNNEERYGNQISYTLKYNPEEVSLKSFAQTLGQFQQQVRCCSVMPQETDSSYEYLPEESISEFEYHRLKENIRTMAEDIDKVHVDCDNGACPIEFKKDAA
jgi:adenosylcobalamin-dependent ribonucleoside-triphosphate reductase